MIQSRPKTGAEKLRNINQKIWTLSPRMEKKKETRECKSEKRFLLTLSHKELFTKLLDLLRLLLNLCLCLSERRQRWQLAPLSSNFSPHKLTLMYKQWAGICTNKRICFSHKLLIAWPWVKESLKMQHIPASLAGCPKKKNDPRIEEVVAFHLVVRRLHVTVSWFQFSDFFILQIKKKRSFSTYIGLGYTCIHKKGAYWTTTTTIKR